MSDPETLLCHPVASHPQSELWPDLSGHTQQAIPYLVSVIPHLSLGKGRKASTGWKTNVKMTGPSVTGMCPPRTLWKLKFTERLPRPGL